MQIINDSQMESHSLLDRLFIDSLSHYYYYYLSGLPKVRDLREGIQVVIFGKYFSKVRGIFQIQGDKMAAGSQKSTILSAISRF